MMPDERKTCTACKQTKPFSEFAKSKSKKDGYDSWCKACKKEWVQLRRDYGKSVMDRYKVMKGCSRCGYNKHPAALEFNHINPEQKNFCIGKYHYSVYLKSHKKSKIDLKKELANCEVLCANCHNIHTYGKEEAHAT